MTATRVSLLASVSFAVVVLVSACSDGGDPAAHDTPVSISTDHPTSISGGGDTSASDGDGSADTTEDSTTEGSTTAPDEPQAGGQRIGGDGIGFTVELPAGWLDVPTDQDLIDSFVEDEGISEDVALSMRQVIQDGLGADSLLAYGGTENGVDIYIIASCGPDDGTVDAGDAESVTVDGVPASRTSYGDTDGHRVWLSYRFPVGDQACWVRFPAPDDSWFAQFNDIAATIDVL